MLAVHIDHLMMQAEQIRLLISIMHVCHQGCYGHMHLLLPQCQIHDCHSDMVCLASCRPPMMLEPVELVWVVPLPLAM